MSPRKRNVGRHSMGADIERIRKSPELRGTTLAELVLEIDGLCPGEDPCAKKGERCTCDFWLPLGWWERLAEAARNESAANPGGPAAPALLPPDEPGAAVLSRDCTCKGTCKGPEGLGDGWRCALESGQRNAKALQEQFDAMPPPDLSLVLRGGGR